MVNNREVEVAVSAHLHDLMLQLGFKQTRGLAVAVNGNIIPKTQWQTSALQENDKVILIKATQGG